MQREVWKGSLIARRASRSSIYVSSRRRVAASPRLQLTVSLLLIVSLIGGGCFLDGEIQPYYGRVMVPSAQEFRWSNGGLPQTFDPALAAAPPDTDAVRAMFEGLTEYDPRTLAPVPGVAARWESSAGGREWTFYLRHDARWSNGEPVTAHDFVRSWQRTLRLGDRAPHAKLLENIEGVGQAALSAPKPSPSPETSPAASPSNDRMDARREEKSRAVRKPAVLPPLGVEAVKDDVLRVHLQRPDMNFPALVAHPIFRPVHAADSTLKETTTKPPLVSNGPFRLSNIGQEGVLLERANSYWDAQAVSLRRVQFVATRDAESALAAYRAGEVDAVTNAVFEPLALKLIAPYKDFRRATYGAI
ncbi:MAG TPA: ABC transporter substrate-binding protein, partial [Pyrinomonadaceae bacterium]|nr:ABC transporter substrate-binding protein [Pyrinomonadaceae bacterium]